MICMHFKINSHVDWFCEAAGQHLMRTSGDSIFCFAVQEYVILNGLEMAGTEWFFLMGMLVLMLFTYIFLRLFFLLQSRIDFK